MMGIKDRRSKRRVLRWSVIFFLLFCLITFSHRHLLLLQGYHHPRLVTNWNDNTLPALEIIVGDTPAVSVRETVILPDQALIFLKYPSSSAPLFTKPDIACVYTDSDSGQNSSPARRLHLSPTSLESGYQNQNDLQIVRCSLPPRGKIVSLAVNGNLDLTPGPTYRWDSLAYDAILDEDNSTIVFVKGLNLRSGKPADPSKYKCIYRQDFKDANAIGFTWAADAVTAAQEILRCRTPPTLLNTRHRFDDQIKVSVKIVGKQARALDSLARLKLGPEPKPIPNSYATGISKQHKLCVCTMLRNQARFLPEWVMYHAKIGVARWFIYDNNSDDDLEHVVESLVSAKHNVTRHVWPWIKSQEAGFAHCALRARDSCEWVAFIDVDEFFHIPSSSSSNFLSLPDLISKYTESDGGDTNSIAEIRTWCRSFGPSGLKKHPEKGVMAGYTCRAAAVERHKSILRPEGLNSSLITVVHHFHLKSGYKHVNMKTSTLVINHYKYQVWEVFKDKFYRRVATYVSDWQEERNVASKDRAPGLGTKAIEPQDWSTRFCEVKDTGLRDKVLHIFADTSTGLLPWERYSSASPA